MKGIIKSVGKKNYVQYIIYLAEMTKLDRRPDSYQDSFIIDMEHLSSSQLTFRSSTFIDPITLTVVQIQDM